MVTVFGWSYSFLSWQCSVLIHYKLHATLSNHFWLRACEINMEIKEPPPGLEPRAHCQPPKPVAHPMAYHSTSSRVPHA